MAWETRILKTVNSQSIANNTSNITFTFQARRTDYSVSGYNNYGTAYWRINIQNGASSGNVYFNINWNYGKNVWFTIASWTTTVTHNSNGYWGANIEAYVSTKISPSELSAVEWFSPPDIARKTTVYGFTNTMGATQGFELNRASASFTHTLRYQFGSASGTIGTGLGSTAEWNIPLSLASQIPNSTQGIGTIYLDTYNGGTLIGTDTATFTLKVPSSVAPSIVGITVKDIGSSNALGIFVQGISRLELKANASGSYGSSISSGKITIDGQTIWSTSGTTSNIRGSGNMTIMATVTDTRGRSATKSMTINVQAYSSPTLSNYSATRQSGTQTNINVVASGRASSLKNGSTEKNSLSYTIKYKQKQASSWATKNVSTSGLSFSGLSQTITGADATKSYDFQLIVADYFGSNTYNLSVSTAKTIFDMSKNGIGVNKYHENGALDVNGEIKTNQNILCDGLVATNYINAMVGNEFNIKSSTLNLCIGYRTPKGGAQIKNYLFCNGTGNADGLREGIIECCDVIIKDSYGNRRSVASRGEVPHVINSNGWVCYEFPDNFKIQTYQATLSITYNSWLSGQTAFCYLPNFPNFAKTFSYVPTVTCQCRQLTTEDCYMTLIMPPSTTNVGYRSDGTCGYINASTQGLKGTTQKFVINFIAIGR